MRRPRSSHNRAGCPRSRSTAHDHDRDQEGVLASHHVAEAAEHDRAERPHREPGGEGQQGEDEGRRLVDAGKELARDDCSQRAVQVEVVPLEDRPQARSEDHAAVRAIDASRRGVGHGGAACRFRGSRASPNAARVGGCQPAPAGCVWLCERPLGSSRSVDVQHDFRRVCACHAVAALRLRDAELRPGLFPQRGTHRLVRRRGSCKRHKARADRGQQERARHAGGGYVGYELGRTMGSGRGRDLAGAVGAVAGAATGQVVEERATRQNGCRSRSTWIAARRSPSCRLRTSLSRPVSA